MTGSPQLLWEVLLDPLHIVPQPGTLWHPQLDQSQVSIHRLRPIRGQYSHLGEVVLLSEADQAQAQDQGRHQGGQQEHHRVAGEHCE